MSRIVFFCLGLLASFGVLAQGDAKSYWQTIPLPSLEPEQEVLAAVQESHPEWFGEAISFYPIHRIKSLTGTHITYHQEVHGFPIFQAVLTAHLDQSGNLVGYFSTCYDGASWSRPNHLSSSDSLRLLQVARSLETSTEVRNSRWTWYLDSESAPVLVLEVDLFSEEGHYLDRYLIGLNGKIRYHQDLRRYFQTTSDTTVQAHVFMPNPITSAQTSYGGNYRDFNNANSPVLNQERVLRSMKMDFDNGNFLLKRDYLSMQDLDDPPIAPPTITTDLLDFGRGQDGFEFVNSYYHLTAYHDYVQSLGFSALNTYDLVVDPHGTDDDNSFVLPGNSIRMILGDGGVDDAEDAGVVIHEYGHVLSELANGNNNVGFERQALDEGYGDYFSASYSRDISNYNWHKIFDWDGHNEFWSGRLANTNKVYPNALSGSIYEAGELWSSTLMELWPILGKENMDKLVIESLFYLSDNMTMRDAAKVLVQVEAQLYSGQYYDDLFTVLFSRGLLEPLVTQITGSQTFLRSGDNVTVFVDADEDQADLALYDMNGRLLASKNLDGFHIFLVPKQWFASDGLYILELSTPTQTLSEKLIYLK